MREGPERTRTPTLELWKPVHVKSVWCDGCCIVGRGGEKSSRVGGKPPHPPLFSSSSFFFSWRPGVQEDK
jgi:hypothetical protein